MRDIYTKSDFADYCSMCGLALTKLEITADIQGGLVLFDEKTTGSIQMTLCADCKNKLIEISLGGLNAAIIKRLDIDNSVGKVVRKRRKRDDEEDGGVPAVLPP